MEYQILIVEDDGNIFNMLKEEFGSEYELSRARSVDEALGEYEYRKEVEFPFDCFIIDLRIISSGLTEEEMVEYEQREGYALLKKIWQKWPDDEDNIRKKTIICSRYVSEFQKEYSEDELRKISLIMKKRGFEKEVKKVANRIVKNNE